MSLFPRPHAQAPTQQASTPVDAGRAALLNMLARSNPQAASMFRGMSDDQIEQYGRQLMERDPRFADFVRRNNGRSVQQIVAQEFGFRR